VDGRIEADSFDICFTNPPFGAIENDESILAQYEMGRGRKTQKREILALERCIRLVKPGGTIAIVLPDGLLNNDRYSNVREYLHRNVRLISVIGLNRETFEGYNSRVKTSILILQKRNKVAQSSQDVFMAVCRNSGYGPTGVEIAGNELPDILFDYKAFMAGQMGSALHNYFRIVKITDAQARIDSEYFVKIQNDSEIPIATISQSVASLAKGLGGQEEFISDFAKLRFDPGEFERKRLGDLLIQVKAREKVVPGDDYRLLGVRWWGKGVFEKELKKGNAIKAATLFRVRPGLLVYNRLFAWKGSFAVIDEEFSDGFVSGEFPLFDLVEERKDRNEVIRYLAFYLCTPSVLRLVERASTGSTKTSRARLREKVFMNIEVPMPKESRVLRRITDRVRGLGVLEGEAARLQDKMGELQRSFGAIFPSAE
jgi:type I restriction enzyme M protein